MKKKRTYSLLLHVALLELFLVGIPLLTFIAENYISGLLENASGNVIEQLRWVLVVVILYACMAFELYSGPAVTLFPSLQDSNGGFILLGDKYDIFCVFSVWAVIAALLAIISWTFFKHMNNRKNKSNQSSDPTLKTPGDSVAG